MESSTIQTHEISRETIKPSIPTHQKIYNLSSMDQINPPIYMPNVLFYRKFIPNSPTETSRLLKSSLSETLTQYYPFAGRMTSTGSTYVDCTDEGVEFQEAKTETELTKILTRLEEQEDLSIFFVPQVAWGPVENSRSSLVVIRVTYFKCGGISIGVCLSHKLSDACTSWNFLNLWAKVTRRSGEQVSPPYYLPSSPSNNKLTSFAEFAYMKKNWVTKKFVFHNTQIAKLKANYISKYKFHQEPSRVSLVVALLFKCVMATGSFEPCSLTHLINMRSKMVPPLPQTSFGNLYWKVIVEARNESESDVNLLVDQMKEKEMKIKGLKRIDGNEYWREYKENEAKKYKEYLSTSLCGIPYYETDFGWGKPLRVSYVGTSLNNMFVLVDTPRKDGIEALVSLAEEDMEKFQVNNELLQCVCRKGRDFNPKL